MTHTLLNSKGDSWSLDTLPVKLFPERTVVIPALCTGVIPHDITLRTAPADYTLSWVMLVSEPGVLFNEGLLVVSGPMNDGEVTTTVFNLSNKEKRLAKSVCISRLIKVPGATWTTP